MSALKFSTILLMTAILSACGGHFAPNKDLATDALTEGQNPQGRSYTSFSEPSSVENMKELISYDDDTKALAAQIDSVQSSVSSSQLKLTIKWVSLTNPLQLTGQLKPSKGGYSADLRDQTKQKSDIEIKASCESISCNVINAFLKDQFGTVIGIIVRHDTRTIVLSEAASQKGDAKLLSQEKQDLFSQAKKGLAASLDSFEIYPGKSYYTIKTDAGVLEGELLNTDEGVAPTKTQGIFASLGSIELIGNNEGDSDSGAQLEFQILNEVGSKKIISYLTMDTNIPLLTSTHLSLEQNLGTSRLVNQILLDENNDVIKKYISTRLAFKTNTSRANPQSPDVSEMLKYLGCEEGNKKLCPLDKQGHDKTQTVRGISQALRKNGLPAAWGLIAFMESQFEPTARNASGAYGLWQFIPSTAVVYKLIGGGVDLRSDVNASTAAAAKYFTFLLDAWNGDVKMAIISYNMGEGAAQQACLRGSANSANCNISKNSKSNEQRQISDLYDLNSQDFWRLYNNHIFGAVSRNGTSGQAYTVKFISESLVSFHPGHYGYSERAVDLD